MDVDTTYNTTPTPTSDKPPTALAKMQEKILATLESFLGDTVSVIQQVPFGGILPASAFQEKCLVKGQLERGQHGDTFSVFCAKDDRPITVHTTAIFHPARVVSITIARNGTVEIRCRNTTQKKGS